MYNVYSAMEDELDESTMASTPTPSATVWSRHGDVLRRAERLKVRLGHRLFAAHHSLRTHSTTRPPDHPPSHGRHSHSRPTSLMWCTCRLFRRSLKLWRSRPQLPSTWRLSIELGLTVSWARAILLSPLSHPTDTTDTTDTTQPTDTSHPPRQLLPQTVNVVAVVS